jgi:predicted dehydrogenase
MNRREFLKSTAGLVTLAALSQASGAAESTRDKIKIGFLGASHSHASEKVKLVRGSQDWELIGICERDEEARRPYEQAGIRILSQRDLLSDCTVVAVESAVRDHAPHAKLALEAGKHVHVEKPPAVSLNAFKELQAIARQKQLLLQVGYMWRFNPGLATALEAAQKGWLGDVYLVRATINTQVPAARRPEWAEFKGGVMFELGCHLIDPIARLLGQPNSVTPFLKKHGSFGDDLADNTTAVFEYPKAAAIVTAATLQPNAMAHRSFEILGTNGTALVKPLEQPVLQIDLAKPAGPYKAGAQTITLPSYQRYVGEFNELAHSVRNKTSLAVTPAQELLVQETLLRACEML